MTNTLAYYINLKIKVVKSFITLMARPDRDEFVKIREENLDPAMVDNFEKFHTQEKIS